MSGQSGWGEKKRQILGEKIDEVLKEEGKFLRKIVTFKKVFDFFQF